MLPKFSFFGGFFNPIDKKYSQFCIHSRIDAFLYWLPSEKLLVNFS